MKTTKQGSIDRRAFCRGIAAAGVGTAVLPATGALSEDAMPGPQHRNKRAHVVLEPGTLVLANDMVEYSFDLRSGAFNSISHKYLKQTVTVGENVAAPVHIWIGTPTEPDSRQAWISRENSRLTHHREFTDSEGVTAEFVWDNLLDKDQTPTGITVRQFYTLSSGSEFLRVRTHIVNGADQITGLCLGIQDLSLNADPLTETFVAPTGGMGEKWTNPRSSWGDQSKVFSVPPTAPAGLVCTWLDLSAAVYGFGTGYLNRRGMDMIGEATLGNTTASLVWRMFRLRGGWAFMDNINGPDQLYPLRPGEEFCTDEWFLGLHAGDWHETARYYREAYERVFQGDFLPWAQVSPVARNADVILDITAAWGVTSKDNVYDLTRGTVRNRFVDIPQKAQSLIDEVGVTPNNMLVVILGEATHWGIYMLPDYFPVNEEAGGPAGFGQMIHRLRNDMGIAGVHVYAHAAFNHPKAKNYVAEADTGWHANLYSNYDFLGTIACMDDLAWWELWKSTLIPEFVASGVNGIEFDEGFGHHFICSKPGHVHGSSAESVLTGQPRGALRIFRECRRALGQSGFLECEGGSDVQGRYFDLWEGQGKSAEVVRYTHPDKLLVAFTRDAEDVNRAFVYGNVVLCSEQGDGTASEKEKQKLEAVRQFVVLRREIREKAAPGYPYGFRDEQGLSKVPPGLVAKAFSDPRGITVTYYAKHHVSGELRIDGKLLGHPRIRSYRHQVELEPGQAGYMAIA